MRKRNRALSAALIALSLSLFSSAPAIAEPRLEEISGGSFLAIQAALPELLRRNLKPDNYRISVFDDGPTIIVLFGDPNPRPGQKGNAGQYLALEVKLDKANLRVIRSYYVR